MVGQDLRSSKEINQALLIVFVGEGSRVIRDLR